MKSHGKLKVLVFQLAVSNLQPKSGGWGDHNEMRQNIKEKNNSVARHKQPQEKNQFSMETE
jgi:hypothetical protein